MTKGAAQETGLDDLAKDFIVEKGYDEKFGARPLKRAIQKYIEDPLAEEIVRAHLKEGDLIKMGYEKDAAELSIKIESEKSPKTKTTKKKEE